MSTKNEIKDALENDGTAICVGWNNNDDHVIQIVNVVPDADPGKRYRLARSFRVVATIGISELAAISLLDLACGVDCGEFDADSWGDLAKEMGAWLSAIVTELNAAERPSRGAQKGKGKAGRKAKGKGKGKAGRKAKAEPKRAARGVPSMDDLMVMDKADLRGFADDAGIDMDDHDLRATGGRYQLAKAIVNELS